MSDEKRRAALWTMIGTVTAAIGAAAIWGAGGILLVFGIFVCAMSTVEYWKAP